MEIGIEKKNALVCGGSKGIGKACALALAKEGVNTIILARTESLLVDAVEEIRKEMGKAEYIVADLSQLDTFDTLVERIRGIFGDIDILVNNTGGPPSGENLSFSIEEWEEAFRLTFLSAEELTKKLLPYMLEKGWGRIINLTSISVKQPISGLILSNSIRLAVIGWAKTLSIEYAKYGITINNIATGYTLTDRVRKLFEKRASLENKTISQITKEVSTSVPMGRIAHPSEIASVVTFLASETASYITGVTIPVDGGLSMHVL